MKQITIAPEHVQRLQKFLDYSEGYSAGVAEATKTLNMRLIQLLSEQPKPVVPPSTEQS